MTKAYRRGISESQSAANAEALERRGLHGDPAVAQAHRMTVQINADYRRRQPRDLREAVRLVRRAYADEVPAKLHDGNLSDDGTPRWTNQATSYIFGNAQQTDAGRPKCTCAESRLLIPGPHAGECPADPDNRPLISYYVTPFRAALDTMAHGGLQAQKHAAIVSHITIGSQDAVPAAIAEGVPEWCAYSVAEHVLRDFLRRLSDLKVSVPKEQSAA